MIEVRASVTMPRLGRDQRAIVDETNERVKKEIRCGNLVPTGRELDPAEKGIDE